MPDVCRPPLYCSAISNLQTNFLLAGKGPVNKGLEGIGGEFEMYRRRKTGGVMPVGGNPQFSGGMAILWRGIYPRSAAQQSPSLQMRSLGRKSGAASPPIGDKSPRHKGSI